MLITVYVNLSDIGSHVLKGNSFFAYLTPDEAQGWVVELHVDSKNVEYNGGEEVYVNVKGAGVDE